SETVDLLPRLPAAVHRGRRGAQAGADAGTVRRFHADDLGGVRALRTVCRSRPRPRRQPAQCDEVAAPRLCRRLRPARRAAGAGGPLAFYPSLESKRRARPAVLPFRLGARAELSTPPGRKNYFFFPFLAFFAFLAIVSSQGLMEGTPHERHAGRRASLAKISIDTETDSQATC